MSSFLNVHLPLLMQVNRSEGGTLLPWPNGSLLSGRLMPTSDQAGALLLLANYRVRVEVPPNIPMGKVWLELLQREKPGQFRFLTDKQAEDFVTNMLAKTQKETPATAFQQREHSAKADELWLRLQTSNFPFELKQAGEHLMLHQWDDGSPQGFVKQEQFQEQFKLHGRVDLQHIGAISFLLQGGPDKAWKVSVHVSDMHKKLALSDNFHAWITQKKEESLPDLQGSIFEFMPEESPSYGSRGV